MKKFIMGAMAALGAVGLYKLHKDGKFPVLKIKGTIVSVDHEQNTFQLRPSLEENVLMNFSVLPVTKFMWLANGTGGSNLARFEDINEGAKLSVSFIKEHGHMVAERVVIETVK